MMNIFKAIFLPLVLIGIIFKPLLGFEIGEEKRAEQIIQAYMMLMVWILSRARKNTKYSCGIFFGESILT